MTTKNPSYFTSFKTNCKNGKSPWQFVQKIAKKNNCTETQIWNSLCKANLAFCKTISGKKCYFPVNFKKTTSKNWKSTEFSFYYTAIELCLQHGWCTSEQIYSWTPAQCCWFASNCITKHTNKPAKFNANKTVKGFPTSWTGTTTATKTKKKSATKTKTKKSKKRTTTKARKTSTTKGRKTTTTRGRKTTTGTRNYKFSGRTRTTGRRTRRAA